MLLIHTDNDFISPGDPFTMLGQVEPGLLVSDRLDVNSLGIIVSVCKGDVYVLWSKRSSLLDDYWVSYNRHTHGA